MPDRIPQPVIEESTEDRLNGILRRKEKEIIRSLVRYGKKKIDEDIYLYQYLFNEFDNVNFFTPVYDEIFKMFIKGLENKKEVDEKYFLEYGSEEVKKEVIDFITDKYTLSTRWKDKYNIWVPNEEDILSSKSYTDIERLKFAYIKKMIQENLAELKKAESQREQDKFQEIHVELKRTEKEIAGILGIVVSG